MRIDRYLFENHYARSRTRATLMIEDGAVFCNGKAVTKPSFVVPENASIEIRGATLRYVSRGGLKLEKALESFKINVAGLVALDFGASTGGFTDCLLQRGCKRVYAIDSGTDQLDGTLKNRADVISMENCNARFLAFDDIGELGDVAVCDLSFVSQTLLHPVIYNLLKPQGIFVSLIKPQFEVGKHRIGKGGIVKDEMARREALECVIASAESCGFLHKETVPSPITGGDGNLEYLAYFIRK